MPEFEEMHPEFAGFVDSTAAARINGFVHGHGSLGRYGGEEFIAVMPETDLDAGRRAAQRLRAILERED